MHRYKQSLTYDKSMSFFDGLSLIRDFIDSSNRTVSFGYMMVGKFSWRTTRKETFLILEGNANFLFDDRNIQAQKGSVISIPTDTLFEVHVKETLDYRCDYD